MAQEEAKIGYAHDPAYDSGTLKVGTLHNIHYEQYGNPTGRPVIFLHGGPGGGTSIANTVYFNPSIYRVVLLDQRGAGKSTPNAETRENTSQDLVADIEALRTHLAIPKWSMVFGGSWGSTLGLLYAQTHPDSVGSLVLRGIFCFRKCELERTDKTLAPVMFPDTYARFRDFIPEAERGDIPSAYIRRIRGDDEKLRHEALYNWSLWETSISTLRFDPEGITKLEDPSYLAAHSTLEMHYMENAGFMEDGQLLKKENIDRMRHIPGECMDDAAPWAENDGS